MSFVKRKIDVTIRLGKGSFGESGYDQVKLTGLRCSATIAKMGAPGLGNAQVRIYGVPLTLMNQVSALWLPQPQVRNNTMLIEAGDDEAGMATVFAGGIMSAWADIQSPDASLVLAGLAVYTETMRPIPPSSFPGPVDVVNVMSGLAALMDLKFENNGVSGIILQSPYFAGPPKLQAQECADQANINWAPDDGVLAIWPMGGSRGGAVPVIGPGKGMVGFPSYNGSGISLKSVYNQNLKFAGKIQVESSIVAAQGVWYVWQLAHDLSSETPGGPWFSEMSGLRIGPQ